MFAFSVRMTASACLMASVSFGIAEARDQRPDASQVDFGRDSSEWANDGECDDPRFEGPGMTETTLLDSDRFGDASDCRSAYEAGRLSIRGAAAKLTGAAAQIDFGRDSSEWANDGECDDPRFKGPGMTSTTLLDSDILGDATDCRTAFEAGKLSLIIDAPRKAPSSGGIDFGNNASEWANDGECDDPRFEGPGMTETTLLDSDSYRDANDCEAAYDAGRLWLRGSR